MYLVQRPPCINYTNQRMRYREKGKGGKLYIHHLSYTSANLTPASSAFSTSSYRALSFRRLFLHRYTPGHADPNNDTIRNKIAQEAAYTQIVSHVFQSSVCLWVLTPCCRTLSWKTDSADPEPVGSVSQSKCFFVPGSIAICFRSGKEPTSGTVIILRPM